jgi:hypothetical protein
MKLTGKCITISAKALDDSNGSGAKEEEEEEGDVFCMLLPITDIVRKLFSSTKLSLLFVERQDVFFQQQDFRLYTHKQKKKFPHSSLILIGHYSLLD